MNSKSLLVALFVAIFLLSACASDGQRKFKRTAQLSPGVQALLAKDETIGLNDPRIRCRRENRSGSRLGVQVCSTVEEMEAEREQAQRDAQRNN